MVAGSCSRVSIYRRHKRLIAALNALRESGLITGRTHRAFRRHADKLYARWRADWRASQPKASRPRGRPIPAEDRRNYTACKKDGCGRPPAPGQAYCSRDHAPLADYGLPPRGNPRLIEPRADRDRTTVASIMTRETVEERVNFGSLPQLAFRFLGGT